jgi:hypothetical protein
MKKQIVLSLSVVMLAISVDLFAPYGKGFRANQAPAQRVQPSQGQTQQTTAPVPTSIADAAENCTLHDVAAALRKLGADVNSATTAGTNTAIKYIKGN